MAVWSRWSRTYLTPRYALQGVQKSRSDDTGNFTTCVIAGVAISASLPTLHGGAVQSVLIAAYTSMNWKRLAGPMSRIAAATRSAAAAMSFNEHTSTGPWV